MGDEFTLAILDFDMFILDRIDRELYSLKCLDLKFGVQSSKCFRLFRQNTCLESFLMFSCVFSFSKASFCALTSSFTALQNFVAILTLRRAEGCHGNFVISHVKLQINAEISHQN